MPYDRRGTMIQRITYGSSPGRPPGRSRIRKSRRNHHGLRPKKAPNPPQTPATMPFCRVNLSRSCVMIASSQQKFGHHVFWPANLATTGLSPLCTAFGRISESPVLFLRGVASTEVDQAYSILGSSSCPNMTIVMRPSSPSTNWNGAPIKSLPPLMAT